MQEDARVALVERFFQGTGRSYDRMVNVVTLGIDKLWKRALLARMPPNPKRVLDLACGTGISTLSIARRFPACQVTGVELREEYLVLAREKVARLGIPNVSFMLCRAEDYRGEPGFDCITSSYLAKYADLPALTRLCRDLLRDGGILLMHDFTLPPKPSLLAVWRLYFFLLQRLGAPLLPSWREIFFGLPALIKETAWLPQLLTELRDNHFVKIESHYLTAYGSAIVSAVKTAGENSAAQ